MALKLSKIAMAVALAAAIVLLYVFDPMSVGFSYRCPVKALTGLDCPGCGGQRAVHALLHFRVREAFAYNPFLVVVAIYLGGVVLLGRLKGRKAERFRRIIVSRPVAFIYLGLMILWTVVRNIFW